eukprot:m.61843 g.61843  ORF g.61843 m.61843 type:complete len:93 (+) comp8007_c1_seq3:2567-2845(+)
MDVAVDVVVDVVAIVAEGVGVEEGIEASTVEEIEDKVIEGVESAAQALEEDMMNAGRAVTGDDHLWTKIHQSIAKEAKVEKEEVDRTNNKLD